MSYSKLVRFVVGWAVVVVLLAGVEAFAQALPNPYRTVDGWASLPNGRQMGAVGGVDVDPDGEHIWAIVRCDATDPERFGDECLDSNLDPVLKFDPDTGDHVRYKGLSLPYTYSDMTGWGLRTAVGFPPPK